MASSLRDRILRLAGRMGLGRNWYLIAVAAVIGTVTAFGAIAFIWLIHEGERLAIRLHDALPQWNAALLIGLPVAGALATGAVIYLFAREAKGHGVPEVIDAVFRRRAVIRPRVAVVKSVASACTIGSGGSAGAEGPIVQIGAVIGSAFAQRLGVQRDHATTLLGCGAAAGIASVFNAPIAGVFFVLEIVLRDFSLKTFTPIIVAAVFSAAVTQAVLGRNEAIFAVSESLSQYQFTLLELPSYFVLGLVCGVVSVGFIRALYFVEDRYAALRLHPIIKPVTGAILLGLLGVAAALVLRSVEPDKAGAIPHFYGNGYETVRALIEPNSYLGDAATPTHAVMPGFDTAEHVQSRPTPVAFWLLLALVAAKAVGTCFTLGSGGSGGVFAPSLFVGAAAGAAFGVALESLGLLPEGSSPAAYALVGMAAVLAGTSHAPLTAMLLLFELTRDVFVLLPIMLAAVVATILAQVLERDSIYTLALRRKGLLLGTSLDTTLLRKLTARDIEPGPHVPIHPDEPIGRLLELRDRHRINDFVIVRPDLTYAGMVTGADLREVVMEPTTAPYLLVDDLLRRDLPTISPDEPLDTVMDKFAKHPVASMALVEGPDGKVTGLITLARLMSRYQRAIREHGQD